MIERATFHIPALGERRAAGDLEAALIGVSGVWGASVDTSRRTLTVEYAPDLTNRAYLAQIIRQAGYPLREQPVPPPEHDAVHPEAESGAEPH